MPTSQSQDSTNNNITVANSFTSSTRPIIHTVDDQYSTIATMSDINGKAPINGAEGHHRGIDEPVIKVQPPRREDLQPSYARVIKPDDADADTNGWYGSMVGHQLHLRHMSATDISTRLTLSAVVLVPSVLFPAASYAPIHTSQ
jgi:hypothetical protein